MTDTEARVEEIRREHGPTPGDDHCACGVRYGIGCLVGGLLAAYDDMRRQRDEAFRSGAESMQERARRIAWHYPHELLAFAIGSIRLEDLDDFPGVA